MIEVTAQMVANVVAVPAAEGDEVEAGAPLVVVESMKMEIPVAAPVAGTVVHVAVEVGDVVREGDLLASLEPHQAPSWR